MRRIYFGLQYTLKELSLALKYSFMRDPCKRCLIRSMCSEECPDRITYYNHTEGIPSFYRVTAFCMVFTIVMVFISIYKWFIN